MALVKNQASGVQAVRFTLRDIETQAQSILHEARREAERIVAEARERAVEVSLQETRGGADDSPRREAEAGLKALNGVVSEVRGQMESLREEALAEVVELAMAMAERVTKRAGLVDPNVLAENLREAMKLVVRSSELRIAIHPSQFEALKGMVASLQIEWPALAGAEVVGDETVTPGGCRVSTSQGRVDADLKTQLDRLAERLIPGRARR
jgi:flagellar assembly protein FliH